MGGGSVRSGGEHVLRNAGSRTAGGASAAPDEDKWTEKVLFSGQQSRSAEIAGTHTKLPRLGADPATFTERFHLGKTRAPSDAGALAARCETRPAADSKRK
jgi:hypothetical protein